MKRTPSDTTTGVTAYHREKKKTALLKKKKIKRGFDLSDFKPEDVKHNVLPTLQKEKQLNLN
ncbi:hypothetical protein OUZ56_027778 [Daphnia magna]|uniref:Uncharacterized protein n=1 Tax=Daphnia magna TaxID=35525 RepID=A0ABR0B1W5_9CRUS|nr:hypothetical protein OUZ56_027778 [Daphnia magna]